MDYLDLVTSRVQSGRDALFSRDTDWAAGDSLTLLHPGSDWSVAAANEVMHHRKDDWEQAAALSACPQLSTSWQTSLRQRSELRRLASSAARVDQP